MAVLHDEWNLSFFIKPLGTQAQSNNIITVGPNKLLEIAFQPDNLKLIVTLENGYKTAESDAITLNEWTHVEVSQLKDAHGHHQFILKVNGIINHQMRNEFPRTIENAQIHASDLPAANARLLEMSFTTFSIGNIECPADISHNCDSMARHGDSMAVCRVDSLCFGDGCSPPADQSFTCTCNHGYSGDGTTCTGNSLR